MGLDLPIFYTIEEECSEFEETFSKDIKIENPQLVNSCERGMGKEIQYEFYTEILCPKDGCDELHRIRIDLREYPIGVLDHIERII